MLTAAQTDFLQRAYTAARAAGHIFPDAVAAEAALESAWGTSTLAVKYNNLFGLKDSFAWKGPTVVLPTKEFLRGQWVTINATWCVYNGWMQCFAERMATLKRVGAYAPALHAADSISYLRSVSAVWSTGPARATDAIAILQAHRDILIST